MLSTTVLSTMYGYLEGVKIFDSSFFSKTLNHLEMSASLAETLSLSISYYLRLSEVDLGLVKLVVMTNVFQLPSTQN